MVSSGGFIEQEERSDQDDVSIFGHADAEAYVDGNAIEDDGINDDESEQGEVLVDLNDVAARLYIDVLLAKSLCEITLEPKDDEFKSDADEQLVWAFAE